MKKLFIVFFVSMLSVGGFSQVGTSFEFENRVLFDKGATYVPQVNILSTFKITDKIGGYAYAQANQYWATAYGGLSFNVAEWLICQVGVGTETDSLPLRFNTNFIITIGDFSSVQVYEYGGSGFYCNLITGVKFSSGSHWTGGFIIKTFYGVAPFVSYNIKSTPITVLVAPFYDPKLRSYNLMGTLQFNLFQPSL